MYWNEPRLYGILLLFFQQKRFEAPVLFVFRRGHAQFIGWIWHGPADPGSRIDIGKVWIFRMKHSQGTYQEGQRDDHCNNTGDPFYPVPSFWAICLKYLGEIVHWVQSYLK